MCPNQLGHVLVQEQPESELEMNAFNFLEINPGSQNSRQPKCLLSGYSLASPPCPVRDYDYFWVPKAGPSLKATLPKTFYLIWYKGNSIHRGQLLDAG